MRFLRRIAGFLGFTRDNNGHEVKDDEEEDKIDDNQAQNRPNFQETGAPRKGFGVQVQVPVERPQSGPVIVPCTSGDGGVQGLRWYAKRLRIDEDGDVADEFLDEVLPQTSASEEEEHRTFPKFQVRYSTRPAKVKSQVMNPDGKIQQCVEYQGRLQWV
ncbi:Phospholipid hydroperoxide glutathione peroxidase [Melia azedarach]|uniref:Phospholipid hydroperoxide glutathione peroxidase n=2 Tax=Melia azedarach TaxID=155640 RepID=A0ACC1YYY6_MELAZ|nr:Phospholipid hydroperoxide glutathione peroxidase [Melia azedarach]KAJ4728718.1 Phospholipid hydroperoxide glutathione peroxidase [Melia azedarach]